MRIATYEDKVINTNLAIINLKEVKEDIKNKTISAKVFNELSQQIQILN